ncbi:MAG: glucose-6-phosphate isomerase [Bacteroidales bacterium]|nr:glucose-6-phosphate isomerase [Bacteroidales bacterium]
MENLKLNIEQIYNFVTKESVQAYSEEIKTHIQALHNKTGEGKDFLGWVDLPSSINNTRIIEIEKIAQNLKNKIDLLVVIGIGGSFLGAKSISEAMSHSFSHLKANSEYPLILFAGQNIGEDYLAEMLEILETKRYGLVVISKSGTTTEPAIAFRILKNHLEEKVGKDRAKELIIAVTDAKKGALRKLAEQEGYTTFIIPDDVGGRFSVLTPVGLVPLAIGGVNIRQLVKGASDMEKLTAGTVNIWDNPSSVYAAARNALYAKGKKIEILVNFENKLHYFAEWWKQLYGESEGKENKGIYPASVDFTADLHSMGQYIQEGERSLFETVISVKETVQKLTIPKDTENLDSLNFLAGKRIDEVNKMAELGTRIAHVDGGVPNIRIEIPKLNEYYLGQLMYFFEKACGISGYILKVNPFNQPGVEAYKNNMFALLEKPGYEEQTKKIKARL